jgi:hypothetical protein
VISLSLFAVTVGGRVPFPKHHKEQPEAPKVVEELEEKEKSSFSTYKAWCNCNEFTTSLETRVGVTSTPLDEPLPANSVIPTQSPIEQPQTFTSVSVSGNIIITPSDSQQLLGWRSRNNDCIFHTGRYS